MAVPLETRPPLAGSVIVPGLSAIVLGAPNSVLGWFVAEEESVQDRRAHNPLLGVAAALIAPTRTTEPRTEETRQGGAVGFEHKRNEVPRY